jgi:hypothetical protein
VEVLVSEHFRACQIDNAQVPTESYESTSVNHKTDGLFANTGERPAPISQHHVKMRVSSDRSRFAISSSAELRINDIKIREKHELLIVL